MLSIRLTLVNMLTDFNIIEILEGFGGTWCRQFDSTRVWTDDYVNRGWYVVLGNWFMSWLTSHKVMPMLRISFFVLVVTYVVCYCILCILNVRFSPIIFILFKTQRVLELLKCNLYKCFQSDGMHFGFRLQRIFGVWLGEHSTKSSRGRAENCSSQEELLCLCVWKVLWIPAERRGWA